MNLNEEFIRGDGYNAPRAFADYSTMTPIVDVHFRNLESKIVTLIGEHGWAAGNVAWLTSLPILEALSRLDRVSIIVQKEDFLRPDATSWRQLRAAYGKLPTSYRLDWPHVGKLSLASYPDLEPIRCVGNLNTEKNPAHPRAHNKFVVLGNGSSSHRRMLPAGSSNQYGDACCVWTGSFNFTNNGRRSLENAVVIRDRSIVEAYLAEWGQIASISESLDWFQPWIEPDFRIGT
ncbi:hypothetical protein [Actinoplanes utahensis]|uniref:hypothetical protein n=1 Tax=Actinoplanes utahensis TaxID=1869 RepID=UPI0007C762D1|nr:hypothetical protein [Actinoplanes utahensis]